MLCSVFHTEYEVCVVLSSHEICTFYPTTPLLDPVPIVIMYHKEIPGINYVITDLIANYSL